MGDTSIEWTQRPGTKGVTWNPIVAYRDAVDPKSGELKRLRGWYCEHATTGCINCYSEAQNEAGYRGGTKLPYKPGHRKDVDIELHEPTLLQPLHWRKPRTVFPCSMTDIFGEWVTDAMLDRIFAVMARTPQHTYLPLTKRADRMREYIAQLTRQEWWKARLYEDDKRPYPYPDWPLPNVWLGVSAERQLEWNKRKEHLRETPAAVRFASFEPLLGGINVAADLPHEYRAEREGDPCKVCGVYTNGLHHPHARGVPDWAIVGGESGPKARPMHPDWARDLRDQCKAAGVAFFFKQWGEWRPLHKGESETWAGHQERRARDSITLPDGTYLELLGKKRAGRLLDGKEHNEFPDTSQRERSAA